MRRLALAAALATTASLAAPHAWASAIAIPDDTFTLTGSFPTIGTTAPFSPGAFTLTVTAPSYSQTPFAYDYTLNSVYTIFASASGTYTAGGSAVAFSTATINVEGSSPDTLQIDGFIGSYPIPATFTVNAASPLFTATADSDGLGDTGVLYQFTPGTYTASSASATLLAAPLATLALIRRRRRA